MSRIFVQLSGLDQIGTGCKTVASRVDTIEMEFWRTIQALDWDVRYEADINSTAKQISRKLEQQAKALKTYQRFIDDVYQEYVKLDEYKSVDRNDTGIVTPVANIITEEVGEIFSTGEKIWKTATTAVKGIVALTGCAATWVTTAASGGAGAPVAVLSTGYTANSLYNCYSDIKNLWWGDESEVGKVNWLKDTLIKNTGDLSEMLGADRDIGEMIGKIVYSGGDIIVGVTNMKNLSNLPNNIAGLKSKYLTNAAKKISHTTDYNPYVIAEDQMKNEAISRMHLTLKDRIIQNDTSFDTVVKAVKEIPTAISGLKDIAFNSPLGSIAYDYAQLSYQIKNLKEVTGMAKLLQEVADVTYNVSQNIVEMIVPSN